MSEAFEKGEEIRKLQVTGGATYIISLPKKWVERTGLQKGSKIRLIRRTDGSLLIIPEKFKILKKPSGAVLEVTAGESPDSVVRKIVSAYLVGYSIIIIKAKNKRLESAQRNTIKEFVRKMLVGTEIIADAPRELVLKVLLGYPELSVQSALRRMCIITSSMHNDAITALGEFDKQLASDVVAMDNEVDRFTLYIIRQLKSAIQNEEIIREIGLSSGRECLGYRLITKAVERTADHAVVIAENIMMLQKPLEKDLFKQIRAMSTSSVSVFNEAVESLFKRDFKLANNIVKKAKQIASIEKELVKPILKRKEVVDIYSLSRIMESIRRTAEYASDIAEIVLNLTIEQEIEHADSNDIS